jgi:hypothetical protein
VPEPLERQAGSLDNQRQGSHHLQHGFRHLFVHRHQADRVAAPVRPSQVEGGDIDPRSSQRRAEPADEPRFSPSTGFVNESTTSLLSGSDIARKAR